MTNAVMLRDMRSQGEAATEALRVNRRIAGRWHGDEIRRVVLTGSGDSWIAANAVESVFRARWPGVVMAMPSMDASRYLSVGDGDLIVVLSVSGEVARTIEVARRAVAFGARTLAVTANASSTLATICDDTFVLPAPIDRSIPHSRDYSAMLVTLGVLLERMTDGRCPELDELPRQFDQVVESSLAAADRLIDDPMRTWFLGAGPDRASAMFGAMKFWEAAGLEAWWDDLEEFGHGSQLMARPGDRAVVIAAGPGVQRAQEMNAGLAKMGLGVVTVGGPGMAADGRPHLETADVETAWHPFLSGIPLQALAYARAERLGLDVATPLDGRPYATAYDEVHVEWTKHSLVIEESPRAGQIT